MKGLCNFLVVPMHLECNPGNNSSNILVGILVFKNPKERNYPLKCDCILNINKNQKEFLSKYGFNNPSCFKMKIDIKEIKHRNVADCRVFTVLGELVDILSNTTVPDGYRDYIEEVIPKQNPYRSFVNDAFIKSNINLIMDS